jgi:hypothetical protein
MHRLSRQAPQLIGVQLALLGALVLAAPGQARADHDMAAMSDNHAENGSEISAGVSLEAATFDNMSYVGSYQGIMPQVGWMHGRFGVGAMLGLYHLDKNGLSLYGKGDLMFTGHATVVSTEHLQAGVALHMMLPTGSELDGLGMGHTMAMPSAWAIWRPASIERLQLAASAGYSRALVSLGGEQHNHGPQPLVDPMNMEELTWSASADVDVIAGIRVGGRMQGGVPLSTGQERVIGAGRIAWGVSRVTTAFELQLGAVGDPFKVRGVVETALRF